MPGEEFLKRLHTCRVLVVDDDADLCGLIQRSLAVDGFQRIDATQDGADALDRVNEAASRESPYDLVLLDLSLPGGVSGKEVYHTLCRTSDVPVIVISGTSRKEEIVEALQTGTVEEFLVKPLDMEILRLKVERILGRRLYDKEMRESQRRNRALFLNILQVMAKVLEAKDPYTKFHSENVSRYASRLAQRIGYPEKDLRSIQIAGILHDFGKIGIKETILAKAGSLTNFEFELVKRHPLIASAILEPIHELRDIILDIRHHHEWWNGRGYPDGLRGEEIPLGARILNVADSYDAMTSSRAYHEAMNEEEARSELIRCRGAQFDPGLVDVFLEILEEEAAQEMRGFARVRTP